MKPSSCAVCSAELVQKEGRGRPRLYCSAPCFVAARNRRRREAWAALPPRLPEVRRPLPFEPAEPEPWRVENGGLL